jgi:ADP-dependent NAD(P)H-hydrate dehydratase / NAD(P)H-hydrate epimerase
MKLVTVAEMRAIENEANSKGLTYELMMENAGRELAQMVLEEYDYLEEGGVLGLVGSGNNGGDTLVALEHMAEEGWKATAYLVRPRPAADPLLARLVRAGGKVVAGDGSPSLLTLEGLLITHDVLLDGILGTGIHLPLTEEIAGVLDFTRKQLDEIDNPPCVVAVDCPSGVDCDSGEAAPECLVAELTVTMAAVKQGLFKFPAYNLVGNLRVIDIGLPGEGEDLKAWRAVKCVVPDADWVRKRLPPRPLDAHKGTFGTVLDVAGSVNYTGAALLSGQAAYRIGAGLVTLAVPAPLHAALAGQFPEATWLLLPNEMGVIAAAAAEVVLKNIGRATALLIGPGFGLEDTTGEFLERLLSDKPRSGGGKIGFASTAPQSATAERPKLPPVIADADGLKLLTRIHDWHKRLPPMAILTPHPGEMSVLTGLSKEEIQADRMGIAKRFSKEWGHVVVLKGAFSVVAAPDGRTAVIPVATPALARAGSGDVLSGLIAGLVAQGMEPFEAAAAGAWVHASAGLDAKETLGNSASVLAGDVLDSVVDVLSALE